MVPLSSHGISRVPSYLSDRMVGCNFDDEAVTLFGSVFQRIGLSLLPLPVSGCFPFARRYLENRGFFLFLRVLRCFSSPHSLPSAMCSSMDAGHKPAGFPIRIPTDRRIFASPRGFRCLSRPSSPLGAKAFALRPLSLDWKYVLRFCCLGSHLFSQMWWR